MKKLIFSMLALLATMGLFAQTQIQGKVVDQNGQPVPGANLAVVGLAEGAVADFDGNYALNTSADLPFDLIVTSIGYKEVRVTITSAGRQSDIVMEAASTQLDEIVISASRTPERIFESPVSVERFGIKDIQNTSAATFYDGLQNLKGVDINTNSLTFQSINTRGFATFANVRFMQLVDGMDNSAPGLNFVLGNLVGVSPLDLQSIEILPGASSALYGAGAFNGILFMQSKNPFETPGISAYYKRGITEQEAAGVNDYWDFGVRAAYKFTPWLAAKANISVLRGEDWHANNFIDVNNPGADRSNPAYDGLNIYGDEVATLLNFDQLAGLPSGTLGSAVVSRTGYTEQELADYGAQSLKSDFAVHIRPFEDDLEVIWNSRIGSGTTIYQGANRYSVTGFTLQQHKLEVRNDNFFIRGYVVSEDSGDSYDTRFAAINTNRQWKGDEQWFTQYAETYIGARLGIGSGVLASDEQAHAAARAVADQGRLIPGTPEFQRAFDRVIQDGDLTTGARFIDNTKFRHVNGNYNLAHLIDDWADIQVGGSFREYVLNSQGTIFTDFDGPITYNEYGAYVQGQKKFADDRVKLTASVRYDKNQFFDGFLSPRFALGVTLGENRNHNLRISAQQGFRNPTTQDLFIGLDVGAGILVGSAPDNLDRDIRNFGLNPTGTGSLLNGGATSVEIRGRAAYENSFTAASAQAFAAQAAQGNFNLALLEIANPDLIQPEEITTFEGGYRAQLGAFTIDASAYYNIYNSFVVLEDVVVPLYGDVNLTQTIPGTQTPLAVAALGNGDFQGYQTYTNFGEEIKSYGAVVGVDVALPHNFNFGVNYTFNELDFDRARFPDFQTNFNTPEHRVKVSLGNEEIVKNVGFQVNYRWSDEYLWEASFATGRIPSFSVLDAQANFRIPKYKAALKVGASNLLNEEYVTAFGTGNIGRIVYASLTFN